jgi:hypothetical protein
MPPVHFGFDKIVRFLWQFRLGGIGVVLLLIGLIYLLDLENGMATFTQPLDQGLAKLGISSSRFGIGCAFAGAVLILVYSFIQLTDLNRSHLSGVYKSAVLYDFNSVDRIIRTVLKFSDEDLDASRIKYASRSENEGKIASCNARIDQIMISTLRDLPRGKFAFYSSGTLESELLLHLSFNRLGRESRFEFEGFGIVKDRIRSGRIAECALVLPASPEAASHNFLSIRGIVDRFKLVWAGRVVSIEMHQLIDPFNRHPEYRLLLQFRISRSLSGWKLSEGVFSIWDPTETCFRPAGSTNDLTITS